jgi:hypothetical protein
MEVQPMGRLRGVAVSVALTGLIVGGATPAAQAHGSGHHWFPHVIDLPDGFMPEGITTGRGTTVYAGSLTSGAIQRVDVRTGASSELVAGAPGSTAVGIDYERPANRLWVVGGAQGTVKVYDASSGALLASYQFAAGFLNDIVVTRRAAYATDSFQQQLAVVPLGEDGALPDQSAVTTLPLTGDIQFVPGEFNANGIVKAHGGRTLVLVNTVTGELFTLDPDTGVTDEIDLGGQSVVGGDGLELRGRTLYVVRGFSNLVSVVRLSGDLTAGHIVRDITDPDLDIPTTITVAAGRLWVVNARFTTPPGPDVHYWITQLPAHRRHQHG